MICEFSSPTWTRGFLERPKHGSGTFNRKSMLSLNLTYPCAISISNTLVCPAGVFTTPKLHFGPPLTTHTMKVRRRAVTGRHTQTSRLLSAIETLIQLQSDQIENASSQGKHMADIKCLEETQLGLDDKYLEHLAKIKTKREIRSQWETEVLTSSDSFFEPPPTGSLQDVLQTPFWLATEYAKAYPKSFSFLSQAAENARLKLTSCRVCFYNPWLPSPNPNGHQGGLEWVFPRRSRKGEERRSMADQLWEVVTAGDGAQPPRTICVQDMSPSVGAVLMATTPR